MEQAPLEGQMPNVIVAVFAPVPTKLMLAFPWIGPREICVCAPALIDPIVIAIVKIAKAIIHFRIFPPLIYCRGPRRPDFKLAEFHRSTAYGQFPRWGHPKALSLLD